MSARVARGDGVAVRGGVVRAVRVSRLGGPEVLQVHEVAVPEPGPGQVRVAVRASGLNFAETMQREGHYPGADLPWIPGSELAGVVEALGAGVTTVEVGARVVARVSSGGYAEYAVAAADDLAVLPAGLDFDVATAAAVHAPTALVLVRHVAPVTAGQVVLVHAAAGGIGSLLVQLLARAGATVIAAASNGSKLALPRALGAAGTVDYSAPDWVRQVRSLTGGRGVDVVLATVAGRVLDDSLDLLAPLGHLVIWGASHSVGTHLDQPRVTRLVYGNQRVSGYAFPTYPADAVRAATRDSLDLLAAGTLEVSVGGRYGLDEVAQAHRDIESRTSTGKLVVIP
jgi:NADPH2:quinone reductase